jgi:hypothetical protein
MVQKYDVFPNNQNELQVWAVSGENLDLQLYELMSTFSITFLLKS